MPLAHEQREMKTFQKRWVRIQTALFFNGIFAKIHVGHEYRKCKICGNEKRGGMGQNHDSHKQLSFFKFYNGTEIYTATFCLFTFVEWCGRI